MRASMVVAVWGSSAVLALAGRGGRSTTAAHLANDTSPASVPIAMLDFTPTTFRATGRRLTLSVLPAADVLGRV
jgi:hypothetical protein